MRRTVELSRWVFVLLLLVIVYLAYLVYQQQRDMVTEDQTTRVQESTTVIVGDDPSVVGGIKRSPMELRALDRVWNPVTYPYRSPDFYQSPLLDAPIPFQVVAGGYRRMPTRGSSQVVVDRYRAPIVVNDMNIAPVNISTRGPLGQSQQVGVIYKVYGDENSALPLFGRRKYPNDTKWEYYTQTGQFGVKARLVTPRRNDELQTNDMVFIEGVPGQGYRVTMYEQDTPQYIPYI